MLQGALCVAEGMNFMHNVLEDRDGQLMPIIHRDLKSPNLLVVKRPGPEERLDLKITDYGLGRRSWGADLGEAGPPSREGAQIVGRTICDRSRKFGVEQPSGRGRNGRITAGCHRLFLVTRWGSFAKETARSQCTPSTIVLGVHCDPRTHRARYQYGVGQLSGFEVRLLRNT